MKTIVILSLLVILITANLLAQEPPGWVNMGNINGAVKVKDILEIPNTNSLLACGNLRGFWAEYVRIWRSTDKGQSWSNELTIGDEYVNSNVPEFVDLCLDSQSIRVWVVRHTSGNNALYYSDDGGDNWIAVSGEPYGSRGNKLLTIGNYLYYGGTVDSPYSIALYRLNQTTFEWEIVVSYPDCSAITEMIYNGGKLVVFGSDKSGNAVRVFTHTPESLNRTAAVIGKAKISETATESENATEE